MLDAFLDKAATLGFDGVMLMAKRPHLSVLDFDEAARRPLRDKLASLNLELVCVAGYTDFCLGSERPEIPTRETGGPRPVHAIMRDVNRAFEAAVRRDPANWFWVHDRWKDRRRGPRTSGRQPLATPSGAG